MRDESGGLSNLPLELVRLILLYLPVKSLLRFTCVCKTWFDVIRNDHHFTMNHYITRATSSSNVLDRVDYILDALRSDDKPCLYSLTEAKTFRFVKKFECVPDTRIGVSNTCHGIICFNLNWLGILLCNPSIQEVVSLPPCPNEGIPVLGFDPICNDYKIVALQCRSGDTYPCTGSVYSVRHGHWRNLAFSASLLYLSLLQWYPALNANGRMCNWLFHPRFEYKYIGEYIAECLLSFDMVEEVFKELPMPECLSPQTHTHNLLSTSRWQACLSCLPQILDFSSKFIDVWVLKGNDEGDHCETWVWSKELAVKWPGNEPMMPLNIWMNDYELLVLIKKGYNEEVFHYDLTTQQLRRTGRSGVLGCCTGDYVESLVSVKRFMSLPGDCKHSQVEASKQDDTGGDYVFREVSRRGVRWSSRFKLSQSSK